MQYRTHTCWEVNEKYLWKEVTLSWWVNTIRDHGWVIFIDLRDRYWITQIKADPETTAANIMNIIKDIKDEYVIQVIWTVEKRPDWTQNKELFTWMIEVIPNTINILSVAKLPPFEVSNEHNVREEIRMEYRYIDLKRKSMQDNIVARHKVYTHAMKYFTDNWFLYIETPSLLKNTPEWAREFVVPSRHNPGKAYVLPQSPQQVKQIIMLSWFDKYFQITKCFRDEDLRWDRQPEFTQIDLEMSFVQQEDVIKINENFLMDMLKNIYPNKEILTTPFPRIDFTESMNKYWIDKPELRIDDLQLVDISDIAAKSELKVFWDVVKDWWCVKWLVVNKIFTRWEIDKFTALLQEKWAKWLAYIIWDEEWPKSPILKFFSEDLQKELFEKIWAKKGTTSFFQATDWLQATSFLWYLRTILIEKLELLKWKENQLAFAWIFDFPMFEIDEEWKINAMHHPFTKPKNEDIPLILQMADKINKWEKLSQDDIKQLLKIKADAYDIVCNWYELWWWSIRITDMQLQYAIFTILWLTKEQIQERFGHMLKAYEYWAPPHGWLAFWFDRIMMILQNQPNIREVIAFPKTQKWEDLMLNTPSQIEDKLLKELKLKIIE